MADRTAMIVEDDAILAEDLRVALVEAGFEPGEPCRDYVEALAAFERGAPSFCVLDLDLGGHRAMTRAHNTDEGRRLFWLLQSRGTRTVIHSGHQADLERPDLSPALWRIVAKPAPPEQVVAALRDMDGGG
jgi:ActR/RegA family two-component response regulator